jgi:hypothetical protein
MPIPAPAPTPPPDPWAWLDADPVLAARLDRYVTNNDLGDRGTALAHIARIYLKVT